MNAQRPAVSVVIGSLNMKHTIEACLDSLQRQCRDDRAELIVADASNDGTAALVATRFPKVKLIRNTQSTLVPQLWKQGLEMARAPIVAFTIAQCVPAPQWLDELLAAFENGPAAVGGPISGPEAGGPRDWGLYLSRYSSWMPRGDAGPIEDLAGDNAAYARAELDRCQGETRDGFWETLVNARLRAASATLLWRPGMVVTFGKAEPLRHVVRVRFQHGRHYASTRSGATAVTRAVRFLVSPLLVPLLLGRIWRRVLQNRPDWLRQFWRSLPVLLIICIAWSAGEASGYAAPQRAEDG